MEIIRPGTDIDFVGTRKLFGGISASLVLLSIVLIFTVKPNYGIDFKGGTNIIVRFNSTVASADVTAAMQDLGFTDAVVQTFGRENEHEFLIQTNRISVVTPDQADQVRQTLVNAFGDEGLDFAYNQESGDRIEVRLPEDAFADLPEDWTPGMPLPGEAQGSGLGTGLGTGLEADLGADLGTGLGTGGGTGEGTGSAIFEALSGWMSGEWSPEDLDALREHAAAAGIDLDDPLVRAQMRRQASALGLTQVIDALDAMEEPQPGELVGEEEHISPQRAYLQELLEETGLQNVHVSQVGNPRDNRFLIRLQQIQGRIDDGFRAHFGDQFDDVERVETVGPRVGRQLRDDGIKAVILALFFILVYIGLRFNMRFAPGAVVALFHDVLITLGILVIIQEEITLTILAALLTIVGYSLNDTIVVFDRIRENLGSLRTKDLSTVVNQSINETLSRTLLTSLTTLLAVLAIYFLGGGLIKSFALAMIIGIVVGTYSSIYVASPVMMLIHNRLETRSEKQRETKRRGRRGGPSRRSA